MEHDRNIIINVRFHQVKVVAGRTKLGRHGFTMFHQQEWEWEYDVIVNPYFHGVHNGDLIN
jgi:hypothetical protein